MGGAEGTLDSFQSHDLPGLLILSMGAPAWAAILPWRAPPPAASSLYFLSSIVTLLGIQAQLLQTSLIQLNKAQQQISRPWNSGSKKQVCSEAVVFPGTSLTLVRSEEWLSGTLGASSSHPRS